MLLTEAGFPSIPTAAKAPWREERVRADVWLQARCYEATLRAVLEQSGFRSTHRSAETPFNIILEARP